MKKNTIVDLISSFFIFLFLYTGISKLLKYEDFKYALYKSPLLKQVYPVVAAVIPPLEIIIASMLLIPFFSDSPRLRKWGLYSSAILMLLFTIYVGYMVEFRTNRPCTCGGIIQLMNWHQHMYFNAVSTLLAFLAIWLNNKQTKENFKKAVLA